VFVGLEVIAYAVLNSRRGNTRSTLQIFHFGSVSGSIPCMN